MRQIVGFTRTLILASLLSCVPGTANAEVDISEGSYIKRWVDLDLGSIQITRTYRSRSVHNGLFGFGWCSELETTLTPLASGEAIIKDCDRRLKVPLTVGSADSKRPALRAEGGGFIRILKDGRRQRFDSSGRLIAVIAKSGRTEVKLLYAPSGLLREAETGGGEKVEFEIEKNSRKVTRIRDSRGRVTDYRYEGENLTSIRNAWLNSYSYSYDSLHNLLSIEYPDSTREIIAYNADKDQVIRFNGRDGCSETYGYSTSLPHSRYQDISVDKVVTEKICGAIIAKSALFEFWRKRDQEGRWQISQSRIQNDGESVDIKHDPFSGGILSLARTRVPRRDIAHFEAGRLKQRTLQAEKLEAQTKGPR